MLSAKIQTFALIFDKKVQILYNIGCFGIFLKVSSLNLELDSEKKIPIFQESSPDWLAN